MCADGLATAVPCAPTDHLGRHLALYFCACTWDVFDPGTQAIVRSVELWALLAASRTKLAGLKLGSF